MYCIHRLGRAMTLLLCAASLTLNAAAPNESRPKVPRQNAPQMRQGVAQGGPVGSLRSRVAAPRTTATLELPLERPKQQITQNPKAVYTSRPLMAVGDIKAIDSGTSTVVVAIDRNLSALPRVLQHNAKERGVLQELLAREFPAERPFLLTRRTMFIDARIDREKLQANPEALKKFDQDKQLIKLSDFKVGDRVSVLFQMNPTAGAGARAINLCKQDPKRRDYTVDFEPSPKFALRRSRSLNGATTATSPQQNPIGAR